MVEHANKKRTPVALEMRGQRGFVALEASGGTRAWKKDILRVGSWTHPDTGEALDFTRGDLEQIARDSNRWNELGHKTYLPDGHTDSAVQNKGFAPRFWVEGDELFGEIRVADAATAGKIGTTICDVSPLINWDARAANGEKFAAVIEHVALTPSPVIPAQGNFVPLAREVNRPSTALAKENTMLTPEKKSEKTALATGAADAEASTGTTYSANEALKILADFFGVEADWSAIVKCAIADEDEDEAPAGASSMSPYYLARKRVAEKLARKISEPSEKKVLELSRQVENMSKERAAEKAKRDEDEIKFAREASARAGLPLAEDKVALARNMFKKGEDEAARAILGGHLSHAEERTSLSRSKTVLGRSSESAEQADENEAERRLLEASGATFEVDEKTGRVKRNTIKRPSVSPVKR